MNNGAKKWKNVLKNMKGKNSVWTFRGNIISEIIFFNNSVLIKKIVCIFHKFWRFIAIYVIISMPWKNSLNPRKIRVRRVEKNGFVWVRVEQKTGTGSNPGLTKKSGFAGLNPGSGWRVWSLTSTMYRQFLRTLRKIY